jgi:hypothetical protein
MRTTVDLPAALLQQAKRRAVREQTTLKAIVERGLRLVLSETTPTSAFKLRRASVKGKGLQPEWRDASWDQIRDLIYGERPPGLGATRQPVKSLAGFRARLPRLRKSALRHCARCGTQPVNPDPLGIR